MYVTLSDITLLQASAFFLLFYVQRPRQAKTIRLHHPILLYMMHTSIQAH
jgi:hypothetical protein